MPIDTVPIRTPEVIAAIIEESVTRDASPPTINDDSSAGFQTGELWIDETAKVGYLLVDASVGAAVWQAIGAGSGLVSWQDPVLDKDLVTAPGSPNDGDRHIMAGTGGLWSGGAVNDITAFDSGAGTWSFVRPRARKATDR